MSEPTALPPDPLSGSTLAAYWSYGYDMPDDLGGGFVTGELLLRADESCCVPRRFTFLPGAASSRRGSAHGEQVTWWGKARPTSKTN